MQGPVVDVEVVVARYREDPAWARNLSRGVRVRILDKGGDLDPEAFPGAEVARRENVGVEADSYLSHLVDRYDQLAAVTVFCQGHPFDHAHDLKRKVRDFAGGEELPEGFRWLGFIIDSDDPRGRRLFVPWSKNADGRELDVAGFHLALFGEPAPAWLRFYPGAQFAITRARARTRPREFYARALELARTFPDAGHCFERTWDRVFGVRGVDPALLGDEMCRYLKPIRRLREDGVED